MNQHALEHAALVLTMPRGDPVQYAVVMRDIEENPAAPTSLRDLQHYASGVWREQLRQNGYYDCCFTIPPHPRRLMLRFNDATSWRQIHEVLRTPLEALNYVNESEMRQTYAVRRHYERIVVHIMREVYAEMRTRVGANQRLAECPVCWHALPNPYGERPDVYEAFRRALFLPLSAVEIGANEAMQTAVETVEKN